MDDGPYAEIRRVVTGHDGEGKAIVSIDAVATNRKYVDKAASTLVWLTDRSPCDVLSAEDTGLRQTGTAPPPQGTRFCVIEFLPGNKPHGLHRTDTIDYVICISGEIDMDLDDSTVTLRAGDVMVQRGTNHAWVNRKAAPARLAFVLIDGEPKRDGSIAGVAQAS